MDWFAQAPGHRASRSRRIWSAARPRSPRHAAHRRGRWRRRRRRMRCCSARSAGRSTTTCRSRRSPSAACCACARSSACSPTCARPWCSTPWPTAPRSSPSWSRGLDIMILRELTGGIYFGEPRGIETLPDGQRRGVNTQVYTTSEIERIARVGFELARKRQRQGELGREGQRHGIRRAVARGGAEAARRRLRRTSSSSHMYADNCAMQLVRQPKQFDVIVTDNLFGDLLSDCAAMLTGSLGMLPSASLGAPGARRQAQGAVRAGARLGARHRRPGQSPTRSRCCRASP